MSRNKCRICGYHFKSDDEIICPECFTARDEDISCNSLSDDLHSHDLRADNEQDGWFGQSENDTFKEEKNDFVSEERKVSDLTDEERNSLSGGIISGDTVWEIDLDLDVNISDSNRQVKFTFAYNTAYDENDNSFFSNNFFPGESDYEDDMTYTIKFLVPADSKRTTFTACFQNDDWITDSFQFNIPLDENTDSSDDLSSDSYTKIGGVDTAA